MCQIQKCYETHKHINKKEKTTTKKQTSEEHIQAACYDHFVANLCTPRLGIPVCLECWPPSGLPPALITSRAGNGCIELMDLVVVDDKEAG